MNAIRTAIRSLVAAALAVGTALAFAAANIDINKAEQADLEAIKGVGPAMSERMLAERGKQPFADWADLRARVKGIGTRNAAKFSAAGLTVDGKPYAETPATATAEKAAKAAKADKPAKAERRVKPEAARTSQKS